LIQFSPVFKQSQVHWELEEANLPEIHSGLKGNKLPQIDDHYGSNQMHGLGSG